MVKEMNLSFEPLSHENFDEAFKLATSVFPDQLKEIEIPYRGSLDPKSSFWNERRMVRYYVVKDTDVGKIVAVTGLYNRKDYPEDEVWLGWFCVDPSVRGHGLGRKVLEWTMNKAREMGYKRFKLYTSTDPNEAAAQNLYESVGLKIFKREPSEGWPDEEILYREVNL